MEKSLRTCATICVASSECPPSAKKSSSTPTLSTPAPPPRSRPRPPRPACAARHRASAPAPRRPPARAGRAGRSCRSASRGSASSTTNADGIMNSGHPLRDVPAQLVGAAPVAPPRRPTRRSRLDRPRRDDHGLSSPAACVRSAPRSPPARRGSRGSSPGRPHVRGTRSSRRAAAGRDRPSRTSAPSPCERIGHEPLGVRSGCARRSRGDTRRRR